MSRKLVSFDWAIKNLLRDRANFDILEGFLSELLNQDIIIVDLLESETNKNFKTDKFNRVDLVAKDKGGNLILIEVQYDSEIDYFQRIAYGGSKLLTQSISEGQAYQEIKRIITVHIVYFDIGSGKDYLYEGFHQFTGKHHGDILGLTDEQKQLFHVDYIKEIFPQNYIIRLKNYKDEIKENFDEWIYFLKNGEIKEDFKAKNIDKAARKLDVLNLDEKGRKIYDDYMENKRYQKSVFFTAKFEGRQEGIEIGKQEGIEIGKQEGIEIGEKRGEKRGIEIGEKTGIELERNKQEIRDKERVKKLVLKGLSLEETAQIMEFTLEEIENILKRQP